MKPLSKHIAPVAALLILLAAAVGLARAPFAPTAGWVLTRSIETIVHLTAGTANAQENLEFEAVADSVAELEETRAQRDAARDERHQGREVHVKSGDIMRVGSDIHIGEDEVVRGDVLAIRGDVTVVGAVEGNVVAMGGDVHLEPTARVEGDVVCMGGQLYEEPGAEVGGQRVTALDRDTGRSGRTRRIHVNSDVDLDDEKITETLFGYLILLGLVWLLARLASGSTGAALTALKARPARSLGIGLLAWLLAIPSLIALALVVAVLCITIIGIPLALIALLGYFVFFALLLVWGYAVGAAALGERVLERRGETAVSLTRAALAGVIVIAGAAIIGDIFNWLDNFLPLIGVIGKVLSAAVVLATFTLISMGAGAWLHTEFTTGTLGRWWRGSTARVRGRSAPAPAAPPTSPPPVPPAGGTPPPPAPPAPPAPPMAPPENPPPPVQPKSPVDPA